jgi:anti-sigma-K factor RskA
MPGGGPDASRNPVARPDRTPGVDCDRLADVAAELALGVLTGRERAEAVPQLDECDACREDVRELADTGDELLRLLPEVTPPAGFAYRVRNEVCFNAPRRYRRRHRRWVRLRVRALRPRRG